MELNELKLLSSLIKKYGIENIKHTVDLNATFLSYMNKENIDNPKEILPMYCETDSEQIFTNGETSIFCLEPNTIDFELLESDSLVSLYSSATKDEIQKYFDRSRELFGNRHLAVDVSCIDFLNNSIIAYKGHASAKELSQIEANLIRILFKNYKIKASQRLPIVHVEADNGYAYVLGKTYGRTYKF